MSPDAVKAAMVKDQLLLVLGGASLSRAEAASLHGKIQNFNSILEGKAGRSLTVAFAEMASGSVCTNDSFVKQSVQYWLEVFEMVPPPWRQIQLSGDNRRTLHVFGDAAEEPALSGGMPKVTCCFWFVDVTSGIKRGGVSVIPWQVLKLFKNGATCIAQGELFAPFLAILTNLKDAAGQHLLVFCDNLGILSAAVSGRSSVLDVNSLLTGLHLLLTSLRVTSWWEHVDSHANPADGGSRQGTSCKLAKRLGIPLKWVKFPFVPACMAAADPTEWFKIFKSFA